MLTCSMAATLFVKTHQAVSKNEDDNAGIQSADSTVQAAERVGYTVDSLQYSHKLKG